MAVCKVGPSILHGHHKSNPERDAPTNLHGRAHTPESLPSDRSAASLSVPGWYQCPTYLEAKPPRYPSQTVFFGDVNLSPTIHPDRNPGKKTLFWAMLGALSEHPRASRNRQHRNYAPDSNT
eukprot:811923-Rhodomonas_salina.1